MRTIILMVPRLARYSLQSRDQHDFLTRYVGLSQLASSVALQAGEDHSAATSVLKAGKSFIVNLATFLREEIGGSGREARNGAVTSLLREYDSLRNLIASHLPISPRTCDYIVPISLLVSRYQDEWDQLDKIEDKIRSFPGFQDFQTPTAVLKIQASLGASITISLNVSRVRSDAFISSTSTSTVLRLPWLRLDSDGFNGYHSMPHSPYHETRITLQNMKSGNDKMLRMLSWL